MFYVVDCDSEGSIVEYMCRFDNSFFLVCVGSVYVCVLCLCVCVCVVDVCVCVLSVCVWVLSVSVFRAHESP